MDSEKTSLGEKPLKILVITSTYPRHENDYAVPWMREAHAQMQSRGHQLTVLAPSYQGLGDHVVDGIPVKRFRYAPQFMEQLTHEQGALNKIKNPLMQILAIPYVVAGWRAATKLASEENFDVIHVHWPFPHGPIAHAAAKACGAPVVLMCHGAEFALANRKKWIQPLLRHSLKRGDLVIANSNDTATRIQDLSGVVAHVLPYGSTVEPQEVTVPDNNRTRILFTGRLIQRKGVEYLLKAIPKVLEQHQAEFVITGDGDQRGKLVAVRDGLKLQDHVRFLGFVSNERLNEEYARCDIWVNPSVVDDRGDTEGLGVGSIEAYAHQKPVIASAVGGIPDTVRHGETGFLVPEKDEVALADAIIDLINDPQKARLMGKTGQKYAQEKFAWDKITDQLENIYLEISHEQKSRRCSQIASAS